LERIHSFAKDISNRLPAKFAFGTATSSWQIEGDSKGRGSSIWDDFAKIPGRIVDGTSADPACDHIQRWREDLDQLSWLGVDSYRFSVSWPRVQPEGTGKMSRKGLAFYDQLLDELLKRKIQPVVTIYHWDLPSELQAQGGWPSVKMPDIFADFTEILADKFSDRVSSWATLNEPWCSAFLGYAAQIHAPGVGDPAQGIESAYRLMLAHARSAEVLRSHNAQNVGLVLNLTSVYGEDSEVDEAACHLDGLRNRIWLDLLTGKGIPQDVAARTAKIVDWSFVNPSELKEIAHPIDWLGVNYYDPIRISRLSHDDFDKPASDAARAFPGAPPFSFTPRKPQTSMGWEIDASSLTSTLVTTSKRLPNTPLVVTENGGAFPDVLVAGEVNDADRIDYYYQHLLAALAAIDMGVDLRGYFAWSMMDNIEWAEGWTKKFGLFHVDVGSQVRTPKASAHFIREILANRSFS